MSIALMDHLTKDQADHVSLRYKSREMKLLQ